jgi:hypothetical protein
MDVFKVDCQNDTEPFKRWRGLKLQPASLVRPVTLESRVSKGLSLPTIAVSGCLSSMFRQRPHMGHLLESAQCRFTLLLEQGTRRGLVGRAVSSQCMVGGTLRDWLDRKAARVTGLSSPDYEQRFRAPERPFSMGTSRVPTHGREHARWKQDRYTLVQDKVSPGLSWSAVAV